MLEKPLSFHFVEFRRGGPAYLVSKLRSKDLVQRKVFAVIIRLIAFLTKIMSLIGIEIRIGIVQSSAIGHLVVVTELSLHESSLLHTSSNGADSRRRQIQFWLYETPTCNLFLENLYKQKIAAQAALRGAKVLSGQIKSGRFTRSPVLARFRVPRGPFLVPSRMEWDRDGLRGHSPALVLSSFDVAQAEAEARSLGLDLHRPWVCFHARDSSYYVNRLPQYTTISALRDVDVLSYIPALEFLAEEGFSIFRIGVTSKTELPDLGPFVRDLTSVSSRSELLETYLISKCAVFFGSSSGVNELAATFSRPSIWTNCAHLFHVHTQRPDTFWSFKALYRRVDNSRVDLKSAIEDGHIGDIICPDDLIRNEWFVEDEDPNQLIQTCRQAIGLLRDSAFKNPLNSAFSGTAPSVLQVEYERHLAAWNDESHPMSPLQLPLKCRISDAYLHKYFSEIG